MVLKLHASPFSTCSRRVAMILHEKKVPFELHPIDFTKAEHKSAEFIKHQPFGQVPYIDDDGFILYESRAICRYICAKYPTHGPELIPKDTQANALFEQAASVEAAHFDPPASGAAAEKVFKVYRGLKTDEAALAKLVETVNAKLAVYDQILSKQKYLAGEEVTLADLFHIPYASMLATVGSNALETNPNVARWWNDISNRPAWLAVKDGIKSVESY